VRNTAQLPESWTQAKLGDVLPILYGKGLTKANRNSAGDVPVYGSSGIVGTHDKPLTRGPALVIGRKGSVGAIHRSRTACWPIDTVYYAEDCALTPLGFYEHLLRYLRLGALDRSTTIPGLSRDDYDEVLTPIPPLEEQHRIVEAIESYLTRLDDAVASLERVQRNLERYRASVLKAAVEGRLVPTEAELARKENRSYEPASVLLERILAERKARWIEDAVEKVRAKGITGEDALLQARKKVEKKYKEPEPPDTTDLPDLPEGWTWTSLRSLCDAIGDVDHKMPRRTDVGIPYVSTRDFSGDGGIDFTGAKHISPEDFERLCRKIRPKQGDVLLSRYGTVGLARVIRTSHPFQASYSMAILKPAALVSPDFLEVCLSSEDVQRQIKEHTRGVAQPDLGLAHIRRLAIPLAPEHEQARVVEEARRVTSLIHHVESALTQSAERATSLRQSILKWAFEGKLVEQDPNDEPASVLLERIQVKREMNRAESN